MKDNDNLTIERPTFVTHLECAMEGDHYPADQIHNLSKAGKPLLVRYDLAGVKKALTKEALAERPADMWRYREMLPVRKVTDIVSLGEVTTPLIRLPKLAGKLGGQRDFSAGVRGHASFGDDASRLGWGLRRGGGDHLAVPKKVPLVPSYGRKRGDEE